MSATETEMAAPNRPPPPPKKPLASAQWRKQKATFYGHIRTEPTPVRSPHRSSDYQRTREAITTENLAEVV
ncbi:unnamed protein product, partial [Iphiclides podalirius]